MSAHQKWEPSDYLLRNEFCPPSQIQRYLDDLTASQDANLVILIACDKLSILRHLVFVSSRNNDLRSALLDDVARVDGLNQVIIDPWDVSEEQLLQALMQTTNLLRGIPLHANHLPLERISSRSIGYWLVSDVKGAASAAEIRESPPFADMLNGTSIANVRRDQLISRLVQKRAHRDQTSGQGELSEDGIVNIVRLAMEVVQASEAAYYTVDRSAVKLGISAHEGGDDFTCFSRMISVERSDAEFASITDEYIALAFHDSATRIYPPPIANVSEEVLDADLHRNASLADQTIVCLVVPFAPIGNTMPNSGVLAVRRTRKAGLEQFTMFELALLRNVALRLSLLTVLLRQRALANELVLFGRSLSSPSRPRSDISARVAPSRHVVPWDIEVARSLLEGLLVEVKQATQSTSATFRVLTLAPAKGGATPVLRRMICVPDHSEHEVLRDLPINGRDQRGRPIANVSVNVNAAVHGRPVHIWDMAKPVSKQCKELIDVIQVAGRPRIGSELCIPVECDGAVVGTMNFESPLAGSFAGDIELISAFAALAGAAIAVTRNSILVEMAERSAQMRIGHHEARNIRKILDHLRTTVDFQELSYLSDLEELTLRNSPVIHRPDLSPGATPLRKLIDDAFLGREFPSFQVRVPSHLSVANEKVEAIGAAISELVKNQASHANRESGDEPSIKASTTMFGGKRQIVLNFSNMPKWLPQPILQSQMYNYPIYQNDGDRASLGCYTTGRLIRQVGGTIQMVVTLDRKLSSLLLLPMYGSEG